MCIFLCGALRKVISKILEIKLEELGHSSKAFVIALGDKSFRRE
jgi:hypothetical protein